MGRCVERIRLQDLLSDPLTLLVMRRDGVNASDVEALLARIGATRSIEPRGCDCAN